MREGREGRSRARGRGRPPSWRRSRAPSAAKAKRQQEKPRSSGTSPEDDIYCNCCGNDLRPTTRRCRSPRFSASASSSLHLVIALPFVLHRTTLPGWWTCRLRHRLRRRRCTRLSGGDNWSGFGVVVAEVASALGFGPSVGVRPASRWMSGGGHRAMTRAVGIARSPRSTARGTVGFLGSVSGGSWFASPTSTRPKRSSLRDFASPSTSGWRRGAHCASGDQNGDRRRRDGPRRDDDVRRAGCDELLRAVGRPPSSTSGWPTTRWPTGKCRGDAPRPERHRPVAGAPTRGARPSRGVLIEGSALMADAWVRDQVGARATRRSTRRCRPPRTRASLRVSSGGRCHRRVDAPASVVVHLGRPCQEDGDHVQPRDRRPRRAVGHRAGGQWAADVTGWHAFGDDRE